VSLFEDHRRPVWAIVTATPVKSSPKRIVPKLGRIGNRTLKLMSASEGFEMGMEGIIESISDSEF